MFLRAFTAFTAHPSVEDAAFNQCLKTLKKFALTCLNVDAKDFDASTGEILTTSVSASFPDASVIIWRDYDDEKERDVRDKVIKKYNLNFQNSSGSTTGATLICLENVYALRSQAKTNSVLKQFRNELDTVLNAQIKKKSWKPMPSYHEFQSFFENGKESFEKGLAKEMSSLGRAGAGPVFEIEKVISKLKAIQEEERHLPWHQTNEMDERVAHAMDLAERVEELQRKKADLFKSQGIDSCWVRCAPTPYPVPFCRETLKTGLAGRIDVV